jgi:acyl-CoA oxidase
MSTMRFVTDIAMTNVSELNPIITRSVDRKHLQSRSFYLAAFEYRESFLLRLVAQRLRKRIKSGMDSYQAFIECQTMMVDMAKAYVERLVLEQFIAGVKAADKSIRPSLLLLERLFALSMIEEHKAWYLENGYIEGRKAIYISKMVDELSLQVREQCIDLVDAFGLPDGLIKAPIATEYPYR